MSPNTTRLAGRTALVTGSTGGLGAAFATALAEHGASVIVTGRDAARGRGIVDRIESGGGSAAFVAADLGAGGAHVRRLADEATASAGGRIDILVNNAAMLITPTPTADVPEQLVRDAFAVNVSAAFLLTGVIAPTMAEHGAGSIINIGSINGLIGMGGSALYSASKAAIHSLTFDFCASSRFIVSPAIVRVGWGLENQNHGLHRFTPNRATVHASKARLLA